MLAALRDAMAAVPGLRNAAIPPSGISAMGEETLHPAQCTKYLLCFCEMEFCLRLLLGLQMVSAVRDARWDASRPGICMVRPRERELNGYLQERCSDG